MLTIGDDDVVIDQSGQPIENPRPGQEGYFKNQKCQFFIGFGWLTSDELFNLRQTDPRMSP
jgi:hypothetical protein